MAEVEARAAIRALIPRDNQRLGLGFSRWSEFKEVAHLRRDQHASRDVRIPLGAFRTDTGRERLFTANSLAVFGMSGAGKTDAVTIPGILENPGSPVVVATARLDALDDTYDHRRRLSPDATHVFAPLETDSFRYPLSGWSPLRHAGTYPEAQMTGAILVQTSSVSNDEVKDRSFWNERGMSIISPLLYAARVAEDGIKVLTPAGEEQTIRRTMGDVHRWNARSEYHEPLDILAAQRDTAAGEIGTLQMLLKGKTPTDVMLKQVEEEGRLEQMRRESKEADAKLSGFKTRRSAKEDEYLETEASSALDGVFILGGRIEELRSEKTDTDSEISKLAYKIEGIKNVMEKTAAAGDMPPQDTLRYLLKEAERKHDGAENALADLNSGINLPSETLSVVKGVVDAMLAPYKHERVQATTAKNNIDILKLFRERGALYMLVQPGKEAEVKALLDHMLGVVDVAAITESNEGRQIDPSLIYFVDDGVAAVPNLPAIVTTAEGTGRKAVTLWQAYEQLVKEYGPEGAAIVFAGHKSFLVFAGTNDLGITERLERIGGDTLVENIAVTYEIEKHTGKRKPTSETVTIETRPLIPPVFVETGLPKYSAVMKTAGTHPAVVEMISLDELYPSRTPRRRRG